MAAPARAAPVPGCRAERTGAPPCLSSPSPRPPLASAVRAVPLALALLAAALGGCRALPTSEPPARTISLSGRFVTAYGARAPRGAYGMRVVLLVRRAGDAGWRGARAPAGRPRRHRQFDVLDEAGRFRFDLATSDLRDADEVAVVPVLEGEAAVLVPAPPGSARHRTASGERLTLLPLDQAIRLALPAAGPLRAHGLEATVASDVGVPARYATLSREFVHVLYGGALPFDLPPVRVERSGRGGFVFQPVDPDALWGPEIELNAGRGITAALVGHEYGHYLSFRMWGSSPLRYTLRHRALREGWALFFSFAMRAWAAERYGDVDLGGSNLERAPFTHLGPTGLRYEGVSYGRSRPPYAAIGALLWSLYDGAEPSPLEYGGPGPDGLLGDNDDVGGHALALVEAVRLARAGLFDEVGAADVVAHFAASVPDALAPSVAGAADHFLCPAFPDCDVKAPPDDAPTTGALTLRPVAPGSLRARRLPDGAVRLTWARRVYDAPWANAPAAYRVYRDGALAATLPGTDTAWVDAAGGRAYEVRAVGRGGESAGAPRVSLPPRPTRDVDGRR